MITLTTITLWCWIKCVNHKSAKLGLKDAFEDQNRREFDMFVVWLCITFSKSVIYSDNQWHFAWCVHDIYIFTTLDQDDRLGSLAPCCSTLQAEIMDKYETIRKIREQKAGEWKRVIRNAWNFLKNKNALKFNVQFHSMRECISENAFPSLGHNGGNFVVETLPC